MPYVAALAFVPAAQLLIPACSAVDCSESFERSQLHPTSLVGVVAPYAAEEARRYVGCIVLVLVVFLHFFVVVAMSAMLLFHLTVAPQAMCALR